MSDARTLGTVCSGIGGFDVGFEAAGWKTVWQIELDDVNRAVLADRFPHSFQGRNLRDWRSYPLPAVACIAGGTPCQDLSVMGNSARDQSKRGLAGNRSGLFFTFLDLVAAKRPQWIVWENVPGVLSSNDCRDFEVVIQSFAKLGYLGHARVLNGQFFGVPQNRRRLFLVAGLGRKPSSEFLDDAAPVVSLPAAGGSSWVAKPADAWAGYTLTAQPKCSGPSGHGRHSSRINLGSELLVAEGYGWGQMVERARASELHGLRSGLDETNSEEAFAAGNAVIPAIAQWIAEILNKS